MYTEPSLNTIFQPPDKGAGASAARKRLAGENDAPPNKKVARSPTKG